MLVTRYLFKNLIHAALFIAATLTLVVWLTQSLKLLELVANSDAPPGLFLKLVLLTLPKFLEVILPLALSISIFFIYNRLIMDNELIVLRACGFDPMSLARPALLTALGFSLALAVTSAVITPACIARVQELRQEVKTQYSAFLLREGVFNTFGDHLTVYLRARDKNGDMEGIVIHDTRARDKPPVTILAKRGRVVMEAGTPTLVVFEGMRQQAEEGMAAAMSKLYFSRYAIEVKGLEGAVEERWRPGNERTLWELLHPDLKNPRDRASADLFRAEALARVTTPWNTFSFAVVALAFILIGPFNRRGQAPRILAGAGTVGLLQAASMALISLTKNNLALAPLLGLNILIPASVGLLALHPASADWLWRRRRTAEAQP